MQLDQRRGAADQEARQRQQAGALRLAIAPVLRRLAARWLAAHAIRPRDVRIDLVGVLVPRRGAPSLEHVRGVG